MNLTIIDDRQSPIQDRHWIKQSLEWIAADLSLKKNATVYVQGLHTEFTNSGKPIKKTESLAFEHDGTACNDGNNGHVVQIAISHDEDFPCLWEVNPACGVGYINGIVNLQSAYELFIYMAAHELRHLWQWEKPNQARKLRALLHGTDETDAEIYAIRMLAKYRA